MIKRTNVVRKEKPSIQSKRRGVALWLTLLFFVSIWMFILGIIVGRGRAPVKFDIEKLQKELAALREAVIRQDLKRFKIASDDDENKPNLDFHEALKNPKGDIGLLPDISEHKKRRVSERSGSSSKETIKSEKDDTASAFPKDKPASLPQQAVVNKQLTIQVLSVKDPKAADDIVEELKRKGYPAYRELGKIPGKGIYYRVRVGSFLDKSEATSTLKRLKREKYKPILILR